MNKLYPIVLAITGASALPVATKALKLLLESEYKVFLILSKGAYQVFLHEQNLKVPVDVDNQISFWRKHLGEENGELTCFKYDDISAPIASGSFKTLGMVILPCSMGKVGRIASGIASDLIERCADVHLKEQRRLIISPRETPFNLIHLKNLTLLSETGAVIAPPIPAWYSHPENIDDLLEFIVVRIFDSFSIELKEVNRWKGRKNG